MILKNFWKNQMGGGSIIKPPEEGNGVVLL